MKRTDAEAKYHGLGFEVRHIVAEPGEVYEPHRHDGVFLFTLKGSAEIKLDNGEWQTTKRGDEFHISVNQLHEAVSGANGWEYLFAASPEEMERQGL